MKFNNVDFDTYFKNYPDAEGYFGNYGGSYIPPELQTAMNEISEAYQTICKSRKFISELRRIRKEFQGRPTPISHLARLSDKIGTGVQLYVKREDLNHTGAHKLNHCMGEVLLAKYMGKKKVIAETGAGQHGVALATAAAYFGLDCDIYMGAVDVKKQAPNVARMKILGARVIEVTMTTPGVLEAIETISSYFGDKLLVAAGTVLDPASAREVIMHGGSIVDATIIEAPSSTKNAENRRDPEMHQVKKGNEWHFGERIHIGADAGTGYVHSLEVTAANVPERDVVPRLVRSDDETVSGDGGYTGMEKREEIKNDPHLSKVIFRATKRNRYHKKPRAPGFDWDRHIEYQIARTRSKVEYVFLIVKRLFGYRKVRYRGILKNKAHAYTLFTCANLYMLAQSGFCAGA